AVRPFVNLGPSLSYHLMYYSISKINNKFSNSEAASPDKTYMNVMDFGFNVGAGCNFSSFMLEVRYGIGFSNVFKDVTSKNRVLSFSLGYLIP
ncbi:MAG: PorT family protein, partial [Bacteroidetes bacterium]|nr:PorT family protein [Bacteroidota bacterium]